MGRRQVAVMDSGKVRAAATRQLRTLLSRYDMGQLEAQAHEVEIIQFFVGVVRDMTAPLSQRIECGNHVLDRARGKPAVKAQVEVVNPTPEGGEEGEEIIAIRATAELYQRLDDLVRRGVPPDEWPEDVRQIAGSLAASYEENPA